MLERNIRVGQTVIIDKKYFSSLRTHASYYTYLRARLEYKYIVKDIRNNVVICRVINYKFDPSNASVEEVNKFYPKEICVDRTGYDYFKQFIK
jgi:hypothetical protein